jgi:hypothetical protein
MQLSQAITVARAARGSDWLGELKELAGSLRRSRATTGRLFVAGAPDDEPWHFTAHLENLARWRDLPQLTPTLVRGGEIPAGRGDTLLVVTETGLPDEVLQRLDDARRGGSTVLGLTAAEHGLVDVAHEAVRLDASRLARGAGWLVPDFEVATHVFGEVATVERTRPRFRLSRARG